MEINILGTVYEVNFKKYDDEKYFSDFSWDGFCDFNLKEIAICEMKTYPGWENESEESCKIHEKATLRHEIIHAFLNESGLRSNTLSVGAWAQNEEMIDFFALQGVKIMKCWESCGCL